MNTESLSSTVLRVNYNPEKLIFQICEGRSKMEEVTSNRLQTEFQLRRRGVFDVKPSDVRYSDGDNHRLMDDRL